MLDERSVRIQKLLSVTIYRCAQIDKMTKVTCFIKRKMNYQATILPVVLILLSIIAVDCES